MLMTRPSNSRYNITALQRGLQLLSLVGNAAEAPTASQIARDSGLHSSTVHRFLSNLEGAGYLLRDEASHGYSLGPACISLGRAALNGLGVRRTCLPFLQELNRMTRESIHLTVRQNTMAVYVEKLEALEPLRIVSQVGAMVQLHCSGVGKVLLAYEQEEAVREVLARLELTRHTPSTITTMQQLEAELERVRKLGYALDLEENEPHIRCIAAPVRGEDGQIRAAFSVTGPAVRMTRQRLRELAPVVLQISQSISERLGYKAMGNGAGKSRLQPGRPAARPAEAVTGRYR